jgi:hypothetical protein
VSNADEPPTVPPPSGRDRRPPPSHRGRNLLLALVGAVVIFAVGLAVGQALEDGSSSGEVTYERTLTPETVAPPVETVTVAPPPETATVGPPPETGAVTTTALETVGGNESFR